MSMLKGMFGDTAVSQQHTNQSGRAQRRVMPRQRMLYDLLNSAMLGQLTSPVARDIPQPLSQGIGGLQSLLPSLFNRAYGSGAGVGTSGLTGPAPSFGAAPTREELGLSAPRIIPEGFGPTPEEAMGAIPHARVDPVRRRERKLERRIDRRQDKGRPTGGMERRLDRMQTRPGYL